MGQNKRKECSQHSFSSTAWFQCLHSKELCNWEDVQPKASHVMHPDSTANPCLEKKKKYLFILTRVILQILIINMRINHQIKGGWRSNVTILYVCLLYTYTMMQKFWGKSWENTFYLRKCIRWCQSDLQIKDKCVSALNGWYVCLASVNQLMFMYSKIMYSLLCVFWIHVWMVLNNALITINDPLIEIKRICTNVFVFVHVSNKDILFYAY